MYADHLETAFADFFNSIDPKRFFDGVAPIVSLAVAPAVVERCGSRDDKREPAELSKIVTG